MRLDPYLRDYGQYLTEFIAVLKSPTTRFYVDTSLLMWLVRAGRTARSDFMGWCKSLPAGTVRVPVWAAHELQKHVTAGTVQSNVRKLVSEAIAKFDEFVRLASERADDQSCMARGYASRSLLVSDIELSRSRLERFSKVIDLDDGSLGEATAEIIDFVNTHALGTDLAMFIPELSATAAFRSAHSIPPGFHDARKSENPHGDFIIWAEVLADIKNAPAQAAAWNAVLLSRDDKTDWVSPAQRVVDLEGATRKPNRDFNLDVPLPLPLLVHEFTLRASGGALFVVHPGFLASALDYDARKAGSTPPAPAWLAASFRPDFLGKLATLERQVDKRSILNAAGTQAEPTHPIDAQKDTSQGSPLRLEGERPEIQNFDSLDPSDIMSSGAHQDVKAYLSAPSIAQGDIIFRWFDEVRRGGMSPFKLGRLLAELSNAKASGWPDNISGSLEQLRAAVSAPELNAIVLAIITSAFFDRAGDALRKPLVALGAVALSLEENSQYSEPFETLRRFIQEANATLPYVPGSGRTRVPYTLDLAASAAPQLLRDLRINKRSALAQTERSNQRSLASLLSRPPSQSCTGKELRLLVAREFLIPGELLSSEWDKKEITWLEDAGLVALDTEVDGGVGAAIDEASADE